MANNLKAGILVISDRAYRGEREDKSASALKELLSGAGVDIKTLKCVSDNEEAIRDSLLNMCDVEGIELILTTGGTGISPRDVTPEATREVITREVPGITEFMRQKGSAIVVSAILSRAVAGIRGKTLIINLPGSPKGAVECLEMIMPVLAHGLKQMAGEDDEGFCMHGRVEEVKS